MRKLLTVCVVAALTAGAPSAFAAKAEGAHASAATLSPDAVWHTLAAGNLRFVVGHPAHPHQTVLRREELAKAQHPIAIIVGCSDSRVPPELVFDQGLGDLFIVRVAGNVVDDAALGSIEYGVEHLGATLIVVLGHEKCGAVSAAISSPHAPGHVDALVQAIQPAVHVARTEKGDLVDNAVRENVKRVVLELNNSKPILAEFVHSGHLKIAGARYDLDTGHVEIVK
ncbi:MAG: mtcA2 [Capsulimonas sp.]|nr:mtcA2 [Capsulimonas sp.]